MYEMMKTCKRREVTSLTRSLYEIKLISLLYFRAFLDHTIAKFELAANVDHMDFFDNIFLKANVKGIREPVEVFIEAKYRAKNNLTLKCHLEKYFHSYLKIRQQFDRSNDNLFLKRTFNETDCYFVMYTNAFIDTEDIHVSDKRDFCVNLNDLIVTGGSGMQIDNCQDNVVFLCEVAMKKQMISLAERVAKLLNNDIYFQIQFDETMLQYHVILAEKVVKVSAIQTDGRLNYRIATFRREFFDTKEEYLTIFKDTLIKAVKKMRKIESNDQKIILELLSTLHFKVPVGFGNKDLLIRGSEAKIENRIKYLASTIYDLIENCKTSDKGTIVTVDDSLAMRSKQMGRAITGAIGNIFVLDDKSSQLMKITDNTEQLEPFAKSLYTEIKNMVPNLHEYKFLFIDGPKMSFNYNQYEMDLASDFLKRLVLYYNQADVNEMERILKTEMEKYQSDQANYFPGKTDVAFLRYFDRIQKWWMLPELAEALTRESDILELPIKEIEDILMSEINANYMSKIKQYNYTFTESAVKCLKLQELSNTIIISENSILTVVKIIQHLKDKAHVVLNFEYIANLSTDERTALRRELKYTNHDKVLIVVCDDIQEDNINTLPVFTVRKMNMMIVTNQNSLKTVQKYFPEHSVSHDKKLSLVDLSEDSQMSIFETATVMFPGVEELIKLDLLLPKPASRSGESVAAYAAADDETGTGSHRTGEEEWNVPGTSYEPVLQP